MPMYNLIEYTNKDEPAVNHAGTVDDFPGNGVSFKFKQKITGKTENNGTKMLI